MNILLLKSITLSIHDIPPRQNTTVTLFPSSSITFSLSPILCASVDVSSVESSPEEFSLVELSSVSVLSLISLFTSQFSSVSFTLLSSSFPSLLLSVSVTLSVGFVEFSVVLLSSAVDSSGSLELLSISTAA